MLGKKFTYLCDNESISSFFNSKNDDLNAEDIYGRLVTPVFGTGVVYDVPHNIFMEQKKMIKNGLVQARYRVHIPIIENETLIFLNQHIVAKDVGVARSSLKVHMMERMAELIIFTSSACLMGKEAREALTEEVAQWYTDLDGGFCIEAWLFPGWVPFPAFKKRDAAHQKIKSLFLSIIAKRRYKCSQDSKGKVSPAHDNAKLTNGHSNHFSDEVDDQVSDPEGETGQDVGDESTDKDDMITTFMNSRYKDGRYTTDDEIAKLMISLLMAGQHTSSTTSTWLFLFLAKHQDIQEALYQDILENCELRDYLPGDENADQVGETSMLKGLDLDFDTLKRMELLDRCLKEALRLRPPLLTLMRLCKKDLSITSSTSTTPSTEATRSMVIPAGHQVCVSPTFTHRLTNYWTQTSPTFDPERFDSKRKVTEVEQPIIDPDNLRNGVSTNGIRDTKTLFCPFHKKSFDVSQIKAEEISAKSTNGTLTNGSPVVNPSTPSDASSKNKFIYFPFGAGRHRCVGESFAYVQIKTIVAVVLANFRIKLIPGPRDIVNDGGNSLTDDNSDPALAINYKTLISTPLEPHLILEPRWS